MYIYIIQNVIQINKYHIHIKLVYIHWFNMLVITTYNDITYMFLLIQFKW